MPEESFPPFDRCGRPMVIRWNKYGRFMGCSGFPDCRGSKPLPPEGDGEESPSEDDPETAQ